MCKSVPQIEAARTRTSTSFGPILGMETASSCAPARGASSARPSSSRSASGSLVMSLPNTPAGEGEKAMLAHAAPRRKPQLASCIDVFAHEQVRRDGAGILGDDERLHDICDIGQILALGDLSYLWPIL